MALRFALFIFRFITELFTISLIYLNISDRIKINKSNIIKLTRDKEDKFVWLNMILIK